MKDTYRLEICCDRVSDQDQISSLLGVKPSFPSEDWYLEVIDERLPLELLEEDIDDVLEPKSHIINFLNLLEGKYQQLSEVGVSREDITIWKYYEYDDGQCNMEFHPEITRRLGENEIVLCVTCWES